MSDFGNWRIRKVDLSAGILSTFAGTGNIGNTDGPITAATMNPESIVIDNQGNIYFVNQQNIIRKITF